METAILSVQDRRPCATLASLPAGTLSFASVIQRGPLGQWGERHLACEFSGHLSIFYLVSQKWLGPGQMHGEGEMISCTSAL